MNGTQQYGAYGAQSAGTPQLDPQGLLGSLAGGFAGSFLGGKIGGSAGRTVGGIAGRLLGGLLPLDAGQPMPADQPPSQLEMQGFWDVVRKVTSGVRTGLDIGRKVGLFEAGQPSSEPISDVEAQCFSRVINWLGRSAPTQQGGSSAGGIKPMSADQPQVSEIELQGFWDVLRKVAGGVQTGLDIGRKVGLFEAGQPQASQPQVSEIELQNFWNVLRKVAGGVQTGLNVGRTIGLFEAGQPTASQPQVSEIELQSFWDVLRKVAGGVQTGLDIGRKVGLFEAGQPQASQPQVSEIELQNFWNVLRKVAGGVQTGLNVGRTIGLFEAGQPGGSTGGGMSPDQVQALLQQALPALQAMAQRGQTTH